jgi:hypothetical protein
MNVIMHGTTREALTGFSIMALQFSFRSDMFNDDGMCLCMYLTKCLVE